MHRTRIYGFFIDAPVDQRDAAVDFWSAALGTQTRTDPPGDPFTVLVDALPCTALEVQAVDDAPRYHLDIETDDVAAETARLIGLGATLVSDRDSWQVLRAPGGHLLCVVPVQSEPGYFAAHSTPRG